MEAERTPFLRTTAKSRLGVLLPWLYLGILACINVYVCREAFVTESTVHWNSIQGQWISLARIVGLDWFGARWWRYWGGTARLEFTYAPLLRTAFAATIGLFHCSLHLPLHLLTGF